jgi:hypothetical protein
MCQQLQKSMTVTRILFLARYRVPHAAFSLQFDHYLEGVDRTVIATPMTSDELEPVWDKYGIDSSKFIYVNDQTIYDQYPEVNHWVFPDDYRGWWLRQQAIKLAYLDLLDYDVAVMQDADTFMIKPYCPWRKGQLNMLALMNTTQGSYQGVFESITGIPQPSTHCFVTEFCAVRKTDFSSLKQHIQGRWPGKTWLDAVIDAVPGMPTVPPWGTGNIIKWFSEYELLGNWATLQGNVTLQPQVRFEYDSLEKIADFDAGHNAVCDAVPDLSQSLQLDWNTLEISNFDLYLQQVKDAIK